MTMVMGSNQNIFTKIEIRCSFGYDSSGRMWDIDRKITNHNFERTRKSTGYIYIPGNKYREAGGYLKMISCLQDSVIDSTPRIGKYINNL